MAFSLPSTRLGWWSVGLAAAFVGLFIINGVFMTSTVAVTWMQVILPFYGIAMLLCGLAGGLVGLIAVIRRHERSVLVWLTMLPLLFVLFLAIGEFLIPPFD
jgi:hypothetical protein